ncbi:hypothetical protein Tco_0661881 [Tanacetum coccineum]
MVDHANYSAQQALRSQAWSGCEANGETKDDIEIHMDGEKYRDSTVPSNSRIQDYFLVQKPVQQCANKHFWFRKCTRAVISLATFIAASITQRLQSSVKGRKCIKKDFAQQRRERMKDRGVDLKKINSLLGISNEEAGLKADISKKYSKETSGVSPLDSRSAKNKSYRESRKKNKRDKDKATAYATQPVSFISCDIMESEPGVTIIAVDESKPIDQVSQRPKSLRFRAMAPETPPPSDSTPPLKFNRSSAKALRVVKVGGHLKSIQKGFMMVSNI